MNITLWILQGLMAAMFLMAGSTKLIKPKDELKPKMGDWVEVIPNPIFKLIGLLELLGAIGLILPQALGIVPILTPIAAVGLALTMLGAMILHISRGEMSSLPKNIIPLLITSAIAYGRFILIPIA